MVLLKNSRFTHGLARRKKNDRIQLNFRPWLNLGFLSRITISYRKTRCLITGIFKISNHCVSSDKGKEAKKEGELVKALTQYIISFTGLHENSWGTGEEYMMTILPIHHPLCSSGQPCQPLSPAAASASCLTCMAHFFGLRLHRWHTFKKGCQK